MKHLKELRTKHGYTQNEIAKILGISRAAYTNIENGKREPDFDTLNKLCDIFNVSSDYLLGRNSDGWDQIYFPSYGSDTYNSMLNVLLNVAHMFNRDDIVTELQENVPNCERLVEIAKICGYGAESFGRLISNCAAKNSHNDKIVPKAPIQKADAFANLSDQDLLIASAYHMASEDDRAVVDAALRKYYDCVTGLKGDSEKMA